VEKLTSVEKLNDMKKPRENKPEIKNWNERENSGLPLSEPSYINKRMLFKIFCNQISENRDLGEINFHIVYSPRKIQVRKKPQ
jgi:hypothetical protein